VADTLVQVAQLSPPTAVPGEVAGRLVMAAAQAGKYATLKRHRRAASHALDLATGFGAALASAGTGDQAQTPVSVLTELASINGTLVVALRVERGGLEYLSPRRRARPERSRCGHDRDPACRRRACPSLGPGRIAMCWSDPGRRMPSCCVDPVEPVDVVDPQELGMLPLRPWIGGGRAWCRRLSCQVTAASSSRPSRSSSCVRCRAATGSSRSGWRSRTAASVSRPFGWVSR